MNRFRVRLGCRVRLKEYDPNDTGDYNKNDDGKTAAKKETERHVGQLSNLQERLFANGSRSLLIILQGMDTSGKDGTIKSVMSGVNPQGCKVVSFKTPSKEELARDFLWRVHREVPPKGFIGIFNRSHYEDVLITRVHGWVSAGAVKRRLDHIRAFEEMLVDSGTAIVKFFLHISKKEQKERLEERIQDPEKRWKWNSGDLEERTLWEKYMRAFEDVISATSTDHAPWYIVPADRKWFRNLVVADRVVQALDALDLKPPPSPPGVDFSKLRIV
jgi:PPK2 family polyphosphate:nucleotide phosphotransferase